MTNILIVIAILLVGPMLAAASMALLYQWLDLVFCGEFRGKKVWRGLFP